MGFWNKVKQGFTQLTGGGGNMVLTVQNPQVKRGETLNVTIVLNSTGQLSGKSVGLEIAGVETVKFQVPVPATQSPAATAQGATLATTTEERSKTTQTYHNTVVVDAAPVAMQEGETKTYTASITVPTTVQPTYVGTDATHAWRVRAFLDVPMGADIDEDAEITVL